MDVIETVQKEQEASLTMKLAYVVLKWVVGECTLSEE